MQESEKYLQALIKGNNKTILEIYNKFFPKINSFIMRNNGKEDDAKDVFHDALMYLIAKHKEKNLVLASFEGYLFTICKNIWRSTIKNKKEWVMKDGVLPLVEKEDHLANFTLEQKHLEFYQEKFQLLSDNCKEILSNYFNGMSYEDIMTDLAYNSINVVRQRVFKCRAKIVQLIKADTRYKTLA
ncbi:sigma-70 family RNA polymerase sigma factor [uncultured Lacinutrix sp.]|uniref:RNA polymerase sigma factor n=1 Tax=uncultured Lacinutrix sp. TaxID=574032 RepID=UPI00261C60A2|nr:sigma-70 family RNA polymerase sigma factor [uncultured Lacinutrix sp.]